MELCRRDLLKRSSLLAAGAMLPAPAIAFASNSLPGFYDDIEQRTFRWFWDTVNHANGLVPDRWPTPSFSSIASVGFALPAYAIGVERGWCSRTDARDLTLTTLRFFWNAPQGPERQGRTGYKGFFYHFLDMQTGVRFKDVELSSVDTTILLMGVLFAGQYYDRSDPAEAEIRQLAKAIYERADWNFFRSDARRAVSMGWHPEHGLIDANWVGYNEGMFVNILALGSPTHPGPADLWQQWTATYPDYWRGKGPGRRVSFGPLFTHQYSHIFIDFRGIQDEVMRNAGFDYFENSRRETYANRAYCIANPMGWRGYSKDVWGLTACDGPGGFQLPYQGKKRTFFGYAARGPMGEPGGVDDGTIAPTAALGSLPFAPEIVLPCAQALLAQPRLFDKYGFKDSFNPSFTYTDVKLEAGSVDPNTGWMLLSYRKPVAASSTRKGFGTAAVTDEDPRSFWVAAENRPGETLTVDLGKLDTVRAIQVDYADYQSGRFGDAPDIYTEFTLEASPDGQHWQEVAQTEPPRRDRPNAYFELAQPVRARFVRYVHGHVGAANLAISEIRVFGNADGTAPATPTNLVARRHTDQRDATISWARVPGAMGYNIRFGIRPDRLTLTHQLWADELGDGATLTKELRSLNSGVRYWVAVESFNETGVSKLSRVLRIR